MDRLYDEAIAIMAAALQVLARSVPAPEQVPLDGGGFLYRYKEKTVHQALVQKLARVVSGLNAARVLNAAGFIQEQGAIHRMLDEFEEDVTFLASAEITGTQTQAHHNYLTWFWQEEYADPLRPVETRIKRPTVGRDKIRAYIARIEGAPSTPGQFAAVTESISKTYSGYIHGASPHIMEMFGGEPPHFSVSGIPDTSLWLDHFDDIFNYVFRGLCCFAFAAKAFGNDQLFAELWADAQRAEQQRIDE